MSNWHANWEWSLPLIVANVVIHVLGLGLINEHMLQVLRSAINQCNFTGVFAVVMGVVALLATILHGIEGMVWAAAYRLLDALPDTHSAVLYSLSAITTYGHANIMLEPRWQLMGALEALNAFCCLG
jgi:vancomycin permeability regulator SanA